MEAFRTVISGMTQKNAKNGSPYVVFKALRQGVWVPCKIWNKLVSDLEKEGITDNVVAWISARKEDFGGRCEWVVDSIDLDEDQNAEDLLPDTQDTEKFFEQAETLIDKIDNKAIKRLVTNVIDSRKDRFMTMAGGVDHHLYRGGLLKHCLLVATDVYLKTQLYDLDKDVAIAGALLHDIGKTETLDTDITGAVTKKMSYALLGDGMMSVDIIKSAAAEVDEMEEEVLNAILHIVLSVSFATKPTTAEAWAVKCSNESDVIQEKVAYASKNATPGTIINGPTGQIAVLPSPKNDNDVLIDFGVFVKQPMKVSYIVQKALENDKALNVVSSILSKDSETGKEKEFAALNRAATRAGIKVKVS